MTEESASKLLGVDPPATMEQSLAAYSVKAAALRSKIVSCAADDRIGVLGEWRALTSALEEIAVLAPGHAPGVSELPADDETAGEDRHQADDSSPSQRRSQSKIEDRSEPPASAVGAVDLDLPKRQLDWPVLSSEEDARTRLTEWAERKRLVANDTFAGPLEISDASISRIRITRLTETRWMQQMKVPGGAPPHITNVFASSIDVIDVGPPTDFEERRWEFLQDGSVRTVQCTTCLAGRVTCRFCAGRGQHPCPPTEQCRSCGGSGTTIRYTGTTQQRQACGNCAGRGEVPCHKCKGSGSKICLACMGQGSLQCDNCNGSGLITSFVQGTILRKPAVDERRWPETTAGVGKLKDESWPPFQRYAADAVPDGLPEGLGTELSAALKESQQGELIRRLEISVLPITRLAYRRAGQSRDAFLVGTNQEVRASGVRSLKPALRRRHAATGHHRVRARALALFLAAALAAAVTVIVILVADNGSRPVSLPPLHDPNASLEQRGTGCADVRAAGATWTLQRGACADMAVILDYFLGNTPGCSRPTADVVQCTWGNGSVSADRTHARRAPHRRRRAAEPRRRTSQRASSTGWLAPATRSSCLLPCRVVGFHRNAFG